MIINLYFFHRLLLLPIQRHHLVTDFREVNRLQINASDQAVVHCPVIDNPVGDIRGGSPLRGAGDIRRNLARSELDADGDIEVVQYLEALKDGAQSGGLLRRSGCLLYTSPSPRDS